MKRCTAILVTAVLLFFFAAQLQAQVPASATWALTNPASGGTGQTVATAGPVTATDETLVNTEINQYTGYNNSQRVRIKGNSWPANQTAQIDTVCIQFAISPKSGTRLTVTSLSLDLGCHSLNNMKANVWYCTDPTFVNPIQVNFATADTVNNYLPRNTTNTVQTVTAQPNLVVKEGETFYLRVYPWVDKNTSVATGKYVTVQNVVIAGEVQSAPVLSTATWPLTDPATGGTGMVAATSGLILAENEKLVNMNINQYSGYNNSQRVRIVSAPGKYEWPANQTTQIDTVYVQFAVSPKAGGTLNVTSFSLDMGCHSLNNMKANLWYSTDPAFLNPVQVPFTTADTVNNYLPRNTTNTVLTVSGQPNVVVKSGESFYLRVYPWVDKNASVATGKYITLQNVVISGIVEGGAMFELPTIVTNEVTNISTTFATSGGNVSADGGAPVTAKGVCWDTTAAPTINSFKTVDGVGSGSFVSQVTGLKNGATYYLRAYATNDAGTAYGEEKIFTTLDSTAVPTVVTTKPSSILVKSAKAGGTVTAWGGDTLLVRGICWNTVGNPTIADHSTENGTGLGTFVSTLYPLLQNTIYYVRAYATNKKGTGYGQVEIFTTQIPAETVYKVVAQDGSGDYRTVQAAFNDVPDFYTGAWNILVKAGTYKEKLLLGQNKTNVILRGEDAMTTILTYDDYAGKPGVGGTSNCYSTAIEADDFIAMNITFQNTVKNDGTFADQQAVALRVNGDRQGYYNCRLLGYQDTYYTWGGRGTGRTYMKDCYIEGSVDFIFGRNIVVFDQCEIHINREGSALTAASTDVESKFGYVFMDCKITADSIGFNGVPITKFILGRPWQGAPRTVFINCEEPASVNPDGWATWNVTPALYAEYKCYGPGADFSRRISIGRQLTDEEAGQYTLTNIFAKSSHPNFGYDWMPGQSIWTAVDQDRKVETMPDDYKLLQNYPNPFNPVTMIKYALPKESRVQITLHNILGERIMTLVDDHQAAGWHEVKVESAGLASGVYFYRIQANTFQQTRKMMLVK